MTVVLAGITTGGEYVAGGGNDRWTSLQAVDKPALAVRLFRAQRCET